MMYNQLDDDAHRLWDDVDIVDLEQSSSSLYWCTIDDFQNVESKSA